MFETIHELPSQVRSSLDEEDQEVFRKAYNDESPKTAEEVKKAIRKAWRACKDLPSSFSFKIIASVDAVDKDMEVIDIDSVKKHLDSFIDYGGNVQWDHNNYTVATIWDWEPIKKDGMEAVAVYGNIFGGDEVYDNTRKAFVKGVNNLSIAGEASKGSFKCDSKGCYTKRDVKQLMEISLCKVPANKHCTLIWYNDSASFTKSYSDDLRLSVDEYTLHKDYTCCPTQGLRKALRDIGYDAHATWEGVRIPMTGREFYKTQHLFREHGLCAVFKGDHALVNDMDVYLESQFKKAHSEGMIDDDGMFTSRITKGVFNQLWDAGLVTERDGKYGLVFPRYHGDE